MWGMTLKSPHPVIAISHELCWMHIGMMIPGDMILKMDVVVYHCGLAEKCKKREREIKRELAELASLLGGWESPDHGNAKIRRPKRAEVSCAQARSPGCQGAKGRSVDISELVTVRIQSLWQSEAKKMMTADQWRCGEFTLFRNCLSLEPPVIGIRPATWEGIFLYIPADQCESSSHTPAPEIVVFYRFSSGWFLTVQAYAFAAMTTSTSTKCVYSLLLETASDGAERTLVLFYRI